MVFLMMSEEISFSMVSERQGTVGLCAWRNQNVTKTLGFYSGFKRIQMVFLMMSGEISFSMVSARQGTGIMSKLSVYGVKKPKRDQNPRFLWWF